MAKRLTADEIVRRKMARMSPQNQERAKFAEMSRDVGVQRGLRMCCHLELGVIPCWTRADVEIWTDEDPQGGTDACERHIYALLGPTESRVYRIEPAP